MRRRRLSENLKQTKSCSLRLPRAAEPHGRRRFFIFLTDDASDFSRQRRFGTVYRTPYQIRITRVSPYPIRAYPSRLPYRCNTGQTQSYLTQIIKMKKPRSTICTSSKIKFEEPESSSSSEDEEEIEQELADVTFGELQKARSNGSHLVHPKPKEEKKGGRKPVTRFREVIQGSKKVVRDPRFESLCGTLDVDGFRKRYDFLFANELPAEREELQKQVKKSKDPEVIEELKKHISWIDKQLKSESAKRTEAAILAEHKQKEREAAKQGKQPFFLKKSEIRKKRLMEKYKQLKGSGKLEAFIEKRRRKNAAKDHRFMPYPNPRALMKVGALLLVGELVLAGIQRVVPEAIGDLLKIQN
ncbi:hypothetical protein GBA52_020653 [Prunus armeniaca]|nr:hypothetical protein GBA52_020653 [Prunus armeniaca]